MRPVDPFKTKNSQISSYSKKTRMASNTPSVPDGTVADIYILSGLVRHYALLARGEGRKEGRKEGKREGTERGKEGRKKERN